MLVSYVLSWDEFMEVHQRSLPKPPFASSIIMMFFAFALGAYGAVAIYVVEPQDRAMASVFCWISVALFTAALWDLTVRTRKRRELFVRSQRSHYDHHYVGQQVFEFDQEKWIHGTADGKYEAPWSAMLNAVECPNVISFWTKSYMVIVPKRVLGRISEPTGTLHTGAQPLDELRRLMFGETRDTVSCSVGFLTYVLTEIPSLWRRRPTVMAEAHVVGILFFVWMVDGTRHSNEAGAIWGWVIAAVVLFLTATTQLWYLLIQYHTSFKEVREYWEPWFSVRGIHGKQIKLEYFSSWKAFTKVRETSRAFLLYMNATQYHIYPKHCMSAEKQTALRELLREKVGTE